MSCCYLKPITSLIGSDSNYVCSHGQTWHCSQSELLGTSFLPLLIILSLASLHRKRMYPYLLWPQALGHTLRRMRASQGILQPTALEPSPWRPVLLPSPCLYVSHLSFLYTPSQQAFLEEHCFPTTSQVQKEATCPALHWFPNSPPASMPAGISQLCPDRTDRQHEGPQLGGASGTQGSCPPTPHSQVGVSPWGSGGDSRRAPQLVTSTEDVAGSQFKPGQELANGIPCLTIMVREHSVVFCPSLCLGGHRGADIHQGQTFSIPSAK